MRLTIQLRITVALLCMAVWNVAAWSIAAEIDLRQPAVPPADSIKQFTVPAGLEISLFASESDVQQPLSISFDDRGRMWVVQYIQYPNPAGLKAIEVDQYLRTKYDRVPEPPPRGPKGADRITIYEDTNGDGKPDKIKDFLSDLNLCSGVEVGYGGVFVIQAPYLLFYADRNQDDIPDGDPEVLLSGFGMNDAHAVANSLTWGPDGWLYGAQGSTVTANVRGIEFQQGIWRYHPVTKQFELFAEGGGNTWGIDFDRFGNLFAGGNTVQPLCHHVPGGYYVKGFGKHGPLHNPFTYGYFNAVQHFGYKGNGLTGGFIFYYGGAFPKELDGAVLYPNIRQSCARWARLEELGTTFATRYGGDFIQSKDIGFRPVDMAVGPDGATYVADWYDFHIAHRDPHDSRKYYPPRNKDGRVWKVSPTGTATQPLFTGKPLRKRTSAELVNLLSNKNAWYSRQARLILAERRDKSILPQLNELMFQTNSQELALQGLWAHYVTADIDDDLAARLLNNSGPYVRSWTIRLLGDKNSVSPSIAAKFVTLAKSDPSPIVRSQLASTAKRLPGAVALPILAQLLVHDADMQDTNLPLLIWWAIENKAISDRKAVLDIVTAAGNRQHPLVQTTVGPRLARRYLAENNDAGFKSVATLLAAAADKVAEKALIVALDEELAGRALVKVPAPLQPWLDNLLQSSTLENVSLRLALRLGHPAARDLALKIVNDPKAAEEDRLQLIRALSETNHTDAIIAILQLLGSNQDDQIKSAILAAVERSDQPQIAGVILQYYPKLSESLQPRAIELLCSRKPWSLALLSAIDQKKLARGAVSLEQLRRIQLHNDKTIANLLEKHWGKIRTASAAEVLQQVNKLSATFAANKGTAAAGKVVFTENCGKCHRLFNEGAAIGPDLTGAERSRIDVLLTNILDPSGVIRPEFQSYVAVTNDGRVVSGLMSNSSPATVTLVDATNNVIVLPRTEIDELNEVPTSLMPEKILDQLTEQQICDLLTYLRSDLVQKK